MHRHKGIAWVEVEARLESRPDALRSLRAMEETAGGPDVIARDKETGHFTFCDCSTESPAGRRSVCYDREALDSRKEHKPQSSAVEMAAGGALFCDRRYGKVFVYHNGAQSYYAARGFRGSLRV